MIDDDDLNRLEHKWTNKSTQNIDIGTSKKKIICIRTVMET